MAREDFSWYLTLDQDTKLMDDYIIVFQKLYLQIKNQRIGIISPVHLRQSHAIENEAKKNDILEVKAVMMSGNLLSKNAYMACGRFQEDLFIDYVDIEYCLRLNSQGYKVFLCRDLTVEHELGDSKWYNFLGYVLKPTHHSYIRRYYITRNRIITFLKFGKQYKIFFITDLARFIKELIFIILFEDDKIRKIRYIIRGIQDGLSGRSGELR